MRYYVDFEFTKFHGEIISIGIVSDDGVQFYASYSKKELAAEASVGLIDPWVVENVIPIINVPGAVSLSIDGSRANFREQLQASLFVYFKNSNPNNLPITIVTDWFEDVKLISDLFLTGPGYCLNVAPSVTFVCNRVDSYPTKLKGAYQHNALWDALALRERVLEIES